MRNFKDWIHALRLRTLPVSTSGILVGSFFAFHSGFWNGLIFGLAISTTLLFQILSNLANDLGDSQKGADNANRVGPVRAVQSGAISPKAMRNAVLLTTFFSFLSAGSLIGVSSTQLTSNSIWFYSCLAIACVVAAILYTVGRKAYGYSGFGDVFVFLFFGLVSVLGVYPLYSNSFEWILLFPAIAIGYLSAAVLNLNNLRDHENDARVGKRTLVVKLGFNNAKRYQFVLVVSGMISWVLFLVLTHQWIGFCSTIPFIILIKHLFFVAKNSEPKAFDSQLKPVALCTFFISLIYSITVLFA